MPVKPSRGGGSQVDVDVHIQSNRKSDANATPNTNPGRNGADPLSLGVDPKPRNRALVDDTDLDAILPAPTVSVRSPPHPAPVLPVISRPLENYWIKSAAELPKANGEGFRLYRNRQYVDVPDGGVVLVAMEADTGLYRARFASELIPSGPLLLRDTDSGIWHPHNDFNAHTVPLTDASLSSLRTELDFSGVEPGSDGLFRHDGKLYVVIHEHSYQVMQDLDASNPRHKVWRLVNPKDPVATESANIYRASRSGETRAIVRNEQGTWVSILTGLRGGMDRNDPGPANPLYFHRPWLDSPGPSAVQPPVVATTRAQVKRYFAESTDQHADDFIARFGETTVAEAELKRLHLEFPYLDREITKWEIAYKGNDSAERARRLDIGARMRRLYKWQGEASEKVYRDGRLVGFRLDLNFGQRGNLALPVFVTRLSSVVALRLEGSTSNNLGNLFSRFSHIESLEVHKLSGKNNGLLSDINILAALRVLEIRETNLWLPSVGHEHFTGLSRLQELSLTNCSIWPGLRLIGMNELRVLRLRSCDLNLFPSGLTFLPLASRLRVLDLFHNPGLGDAPNVSLMSELRELNLARTGISQPPVGLGLANGPTQLEVLNLSHNPLAVAPSLRGMPALTEVDLSRTLIQNFPEGVTSELPKTRLDLAFTSILAIPDTVELRTAIELDGARITDPTSLRRLIAARRQTGRDVWLDREHPGSGINHWLHNVPATQHFEKIALWNALAGQENLTMMRRFAELVRTPEFRVERPLLQRRVWSFLEHFKEASLGEQEALRDMAVTEPSPGKMLDRLEEEIKNFDPTWQHQPPHHLPKRPKLD
ncbi:leucine-rich repeat domain-containing protein [Pseudomonas granadensis]|uniref:Leucine-rich repeat domain-containing protein n=1 Tax=Pseudomonas granadensis TaxID=1421430 RepID=A0ABX7GHW1_9PSED|nr:leucine-rich repeat domain-containing protein [Pseudomonas granadensis]QRK84712.1 leucine-rich repeat domain-containing protein [Pseudomonas granadensis]